VCAGDVTTLQAWAADAVIVPPIAAGDILCTDGSTEKPSAFASSGKTAMGVVFYVDTSGAHGWAVHLQDQDLGCEWGGYNLPIPNLPDHSNNYAAISDYNGYSNTSAIRAAGPASTYPAAWLVDIDNGWYLPSAGQLRLLYAEMVTVNASLSAVGGIPLPMNVNQPSYGGYWSSTEVNDYSAWYVGWDGNVDSSSKKLFTRRIRSVRSF
jgi:hypothetical protein